MHWARWENGRRRSWGRGSLRLRDAREQQAETDTEIRGKAAELADWLSVSDRNVDQQLHAMEARLAGLEKAYALARDVVVASSWADELGQRLNRLEAAVSVASSVNLAEFDTPEQAAARAVAGTEEAVA